MSYRLVDPDTGENLSTVQSLAEAARTGDDLNGWDIEIYHHSGRYEGTVGEVWDELGLDA